jgi:hypothetical protein
MQMITLNFLEFYNGKYIDQAYELYILRDTENNPMYVGISRFSIWERWFGGGLSHMATNKGGKVYGISSIGRVIERRLPSSWNWIIELCTIEDCMQSLAKEFDGKDTTKFGIDKFESILIQQLNPLYNVVHGGGHHEDPLLTDKLDDAYRKLFD